MSTTATRAREQERVGITDHGVFAISAVATVVGMAIWFLASTMSHDGENTGTMVGILVASIGLIFFFPALKGYLLARRKVLVGTRRRSYEVASLRRPRISNE